MFYNPISNYKNNKKNPCKIVNILATHILALLLFFNFFNKN